MNESELFSGANAVKTVRMRAMPVLDFSAEALGNLLNLQNHNLPDL